MSDREEPSKLKLALDKRRILLVEDNSQLLSTVSAHLFRAGAWDVWQAHTVSRAKELWSEHHSGIDVVLADASLPDGRGSELLRAFCSAEQKLSCLLISGNPALPAAERKAHTFLGKPFTEAELVVAINGL